MQYRSFFTVLTVVGASGLGCGCAAELPQAVAEPPQAVARALPAEPGGGKRAPLVPRPPAHVYQAAARSVSRLHQELLQQEAAHGVLPAAVVGPLMEQWVFWEELDAAWLEGWGYEITDCAYRLTDEGRDTDTHVALMLRPRRVAWCSAVETLAAVCGALNEAGIPVAWWMSQGLYVDVPSGRFAAARRILLGLTGHESLSVYSARR